MITNVYLLSNIENFELSYIIKILLDIKKSNHWVGIEPTACSRGIFSQRNIYILRVEQKNILLVFQLNILKKSFLKLTH